LLLLNSGNVKKRPISAHFSSPTTGAHGGTNPTKNKEQVAGNKARGFWWFRAFIVNYKVAFEGDKLSLGA